MRSVIAKVTRNGQISLPAPIRRRWQTREVRIVDHGDHVEVVPLAEDPIAAVRGMFPPVPGGLERLRAADREEEAEREDQRASS
jgi:AbrB family looped-hinge helix DNA binding protein